MPPPGLQSQNGQTPKAKASASSSGIINGFRVFLGQQKKGQPESDPASSSPTDTAPPSDYLNSASPSTDSLSQGRSFNPTRPAAVDKNQEESEGLRSGRITGPPELEALLVKIGDQNVIKDRCKAAKALADTIREYKLKGIGEIWMHTCDLLDQPGDSASFGAALDLFHACLNTDDLSSFDKRILFDTIIKQLGPDTDQFIECMALLTKDGRSLASVDMSRFVPLLAKHVKSSNEAVVIARKQIKLEKAGSSSVEYARLTRVFQYMTESVKFSASMFSAA